MNDTELDEMLNTWTAPTPSASLRARVQAGFVASPERKTFTGARVRRFAFAATTLGIGVLLLVVTQALPQTTSAIRIPYTVDSEFVRYSDHESPAVEMLLTSYTGQSGFETLLARSIPGHPLDTALGRTLDVALPFWGRLITSFTLPLTIPNYQELESKRQAVVRNSVGFITDCADKRCLELDRHFFVRAAAGVGACGMNGPVVGSETILNYPTTAIELRLFDRLRWTVWLAPDLGCFALRIKSEGHRPDGTFHLLAVKQALKVTLNP